MEHVSVLVEFKFVWDLLLVVFGVVLGDLVTIFKVDFVAETFFAGIVIFLAVLCLVEIDRKRKFGQKYAKM